MSQQVCEKENEKIVMTEKVVTITEQYLFHIHLINNINFLFLPGDTPMDFPPIMPHTGSYFSLL